MKQHRLYATAQNRSRGFSTLELLLVMVVSLVIAALAIPKFDQVRRSLRIQGDARDLNGAINQAKLMAAADFTDSRVYFDLGANQINTFHVDVWNKALNGGNGCWQTVDDPIPAAPFVRCTLPGISPVQRLSTGVTFGFGGLGAPPANTQTNGIQQGPRCLPVNGKKVGIVPTTACVHFSSRGVPITPATGVPTPDDAVYITDGAQVYGVTVGQAGLSQVWANNLNANGWYRK